MKKIIPFIVLTITISTSLFSCYTKIPPSLGETQCKKEKNLSVERIMQTFPFKDAATIQLISFDFNFDDTDTNYNIGVPIKENKLNYNKITKYLSLSDKEISALIHILFQYKPTGGISNLNCYSPLHGIVFINEQNQIIEYIELCFQCQNSRDYTEKSDWKIYCSAQWELLESFFKERNFSVSSD